MTHLRIQNIDEVFLSIEKKYIEIFIAFKNFIILS